jgi:hypothetical protein
MNHYDINDWLDYELYKKGAIANDLKFFEDKLKPVERELNGYRQCEEDYRRMNNVYANNNTIAVMEARQHLREDYGYQVASRNHYEYTSEIKWIKKQIEVSID